MDDTWINDKYCIVWVSFVCQFFCLFGDFQVGGLKVVNQMFGISQSEASFMYYMKADGILGLAYASIAVEGVMPVFNNMVKEGLIENDYFSVYLSRYKLFGSSQFSLETLSTLLLKSNLFFYRSPDTGSEVVFGGYDPDHYNGDLRWIPLSSANYWQIKMDRCVIMCML